MTTHRACKFEFAEAETKGRDAFENGEKFRDGNPYSVDDKQNEWDAWRRGWKHASAAKSFGKLIEKGRTA